VATKACALIETAVGKIKDVLKVLHGVSGIREADAMTGE
jgi:hypothetical protein